MSSDAAPSPEFRLQTGRITVVLGPDDARRDLIDRLDPGCAQGVLVNRLTDGLDAADRRMVLDAVRTLAAAGPAVIVDDADPIAALAVADDALRAGADGSVSMDALEFQRAS